MKSKVKLLFFPQIVGISHTIPMIHAARLCASHPDVQVTIITSSQNVQRFQNEIDRDRKAGHDISFDIVELAKAEFGLPDDVETICSSTSYELKAKLFKAMSMLKEPVRALLGAHRPDCLVSDVLSPWTLDIADEFEIPRLAFHVSSLFSIVIDDSLKRFKLQETVGSDNEPFLLPGLPDEVQFTRSRLPNSYRGHSIETAQTFIKAIEDSLANSYGMMVNSFYDLENKYVEYCKNVIGLELCLVGPVCQYSANNNVVVQDYYGKDKEILRWLDSKGPNAVVYISFGSIYASLCKEQFHELAHGLEASGHPFIWVARANFSGEPSEEGWFPEGFEERMRVSNQGLIIKEWAPQLLILGHPSVGAFMSQCGWNSCLEGLSKGVPFITWPIGVEQFFNESLFVDVLKIGIAVGNEEWKADDEEAKVTVSRNKVEKAVKKILGLTEEVVEMRARAKNYADKSKIAIQDGGSSYSEICELVRVLKARHQE